jgi:G:T/U-mismatch repair DNA glycosylase
MSTVKIKHKFLNHEIDPQAEMLIIGTFNPGHECNKDNEFFYDSTGNRLWKLLPNAFGEEDLRKSTRDQKLKFSRDKRIDFIDIIEEIEVEEEHACKREDKYIDGKVTQWRNVSGELQKLSSLKRACFTRSTFKDVHNIKEEVYKLNKYLETRKLQLWLMRTPAWYPHKDEQSLWINFLFGKE